MTMHASLTGEPAADASARPARDAGRIDAIQVMRGIAALLVLLHHAQFKLQHFEWNPLAGFRAGDVGVDIFFIVSGFVMCHSVRLRHRQAGAIPKFLAGRAMRILPLYWLLTALAGAVFLWSPALVNSSGGTTDVWRSFLLLPTDHKLLIENGWTLSFEFWFYAIFSLGLLWPAMRGRALVLFLLVMSAAAGAVLRPTSPGLRLVTSELLLEFAAGMLVYIAWEQGWRLRRSMRIFLGLAAVVGWGFVDLGMGTGVRVVDYGLPATLLCAALVTGAGPMRTGEWPASARWLGDVSYSLYLVHPFVLAAVSHATSMTASRWPGSSLIAGPAMIIGALVTADLLYRLVERPLHRVAHRITAGAPS